MDEAGRNDPCPCGSGRKYKRCCLERDREAVGTLRFPAEIREAAAGTRVWEADIVPLAVALDDDPAARPDAELVAAAGFVLHSAIASRPSAEPGDVAGRLVDAVGRAAESVGTWPATLRVRHAEVAAALAPLLAQHQVAVERDAFDHLDVLAHSLITDLTGEPPGRFGARPETWAGWGLSGRVVAGLFEAAAAFWRARPWVWLANAQALDVALPDGRRWTTSVLGNAGQEFGLVLYSAFADFEALMDAPGFSTAFAQPAGRVLSVVYARRHELSRRTQREVVTSGWQVAAVDAYPLLMAINTPAGGVSRQDAADLTTVLRAVAAMTATADNGERLSRGETLEWRDPETGILLRHESPECDAGEPAPWPPPRELLPGGPEGPGARPESVLDGLRDEVPDWIERAILLLAGFGAALRGQGFSESTVDKHTTNVDTFLMFLGERQGVPLSAVHEFDLRVFLFDWYPRKVLDAAYRQDAMPTSLERFFRWLADEEGIHCAWASRVLSERDVYRARLLDLSDRPWWDDSMDGWRAELYADLHERVMLHDAGLGQTETWGEDGPFGWSMNPGEARLDHLLQRAWLRWREELIRSGVTSPALVRGHLVARQREWETTPRPDLNAQTPFQAIRRERAARHARR